MTVAIFSFLISHGLNLSPPELVLKIQRIFANDLMKMPTQLFSNHYLLRCFIQIKLFNLNPLTTFHSQLRLFTDQYRLTIKPICQKSIQTEVIFQHFQLAYIQRLKPSIQNQIHFLTDPSIRLTFLVYFQSSRSH